MSNEKKEKELTSWWGNYYKVLKNVLKGLSIENITILASGLVYSTLIALIPCLTFLFTFLSSFDALQSFFENLTIWLTNTFGDEASAEILSELVNYSANAMRLGAIGLVSYFYTGILLVNKIYMVINQIYKTRPQNGVVKRYGTFVIFLIVFTVLIAMIFALSSTLMARFEAYVNNTELTMTMAIVVRKIGSLALVWFSFFLFLIAVPNTKVRNSSAAIGATTGLVFISIVNFAFSFLVSKLVSYWTIYGTLASIFFVLLYLYIFWYILIAITEIAYIHQFKPDGNTISGLSQSPAKTIAEAINLLLMICDRYQKGEGVTSIKDISRTLRIPISRIMKYLRELDEAGFIIASNNQYTSFVPGRPLGSISVRDVIHLLYGVDEVNSDSIENVGDSIAIELYQKGEKGFTFLTMEKLLERI
ncbi:MAG: YihY family inner membrane protein [Spirochaetales bacterium]|nr:YihY family inner membrane protein [Spirochaetales bacterium]